MSCVKETHVQRNQPKPCKGKGIDLFPSLMSTFFPLRMMSEFFFFENDV